MIVYFLACAALEACLAKAIWIDLVGGSPPTEAMAAHRGDRKTYN